MIVFDVYICEIYRCLCVIEVNLYAVIRNAYRPEQSAWSDSRIEVVDLIRRSNLPLIEIQSYKGECSVVLMPIQPNVHTLHEAIVDIEEEGAGGASVRVCSCPGTLDLSGCNCAVEIGYRRWLDAMSDREEVENFGSWPKRLDASGNGSWSVTVR